MSAVEEDDVETTAVEGRGGKRGAKVSCRSSAYGQSST